MTLIRAAVKNRRRTIANLSLAVFSIALSLLFAEVIARQVVALDSGTSFLYRVPDPVLGWVLEPNASYRNVMPETTVRVTYSSLGLRDVEHQFEKSKGVFRILVLGDSFMEGYSVELGEAFHRRIEDIAATRGLNVETINLGVGGYGTLQQHLSYSSIGKLFNPDLVLLGFLTANDVRNNSRELESLVTEDTLKIQARPYLDLSESGMWTITQVDYEGALESYARAKAERDSFWHRMKRSSAVLKTTLDAGGEVKVVARKAINKVERVLNDKQQTNGSFEAEPRTETVHRQDEAMFGESFCEEPEIISTAWETAGTIIERLSIDIRAQGTEFVVFSVPSMRNVESNEMERIERALGERNLACFEQAPANERLGRMLTVLDVMFVDLLPTFRVASREEKKLLFRFSDKHWNLEGHDLAARKVFTELEQASLLPRWGDAAN